MVSLMATVGPLPPSEKALINALMDSTPLRG
jgi:hypothetical protein